MTAVTAGSRARAAGRLRGVLAAAVLIACAAGLLLQAVNNAAVPGHAVVWGPAVVEGAFGKRRIAFVDAPGRMRLEFMEQLEPAPHQDAVQGTAAAPGPVRRSRHGVPAECFRRGSR